MRWYTTGSTGPVEVERRQRGRICSVEGCGRKHRGRGYCDSHLARLLKTGDPGPAEFEPRRPGATCSVGGCDNPHSGRGLCDKHLQRLRKTGDPLTPRREHGVRWTGDDATYNAIHQRLRKAHGPAKAHACITCGKTAQHWAYDHEDPNEKRDEKGRPFSVDPNHYRPMCKTCHRRFDVQFMPEVVCSIAGCVRKQKAKGLCSAHYQVARTADSAL